MNFMHLALMFLFVFSSCQRIERIDTFIESDGLLVVEAEHFFKQDSTAHRQWHLFSRDHQPQVLPDARQTHADPWGTALVSMSSRSANTSIILRASILPAIAFTAPKSILSMLCATTNLLKHRAISP